MDNIEMFIACRDGEADMEELFDSEAEFLEAAIEARDVGEEVDSMFGEDGLDVALEKARANGIIN